MLSLKQALKGMEPVIERLNAERRQIASQITISAFTPLFEKHPQIESIRIAHDESYDDENYTFHGDYFGEAWVINDMDPWDDRYFDQVKQEGSWRYENVPKPGMEWYESAQADVESFVSGAYSGMLEEFFGAYIEIKVSRVGSDIFVDVYRV